MIGYLTGKATIVDNKRLIILTDGGVGYDVFASSLAMAKALPGERTELFVVTIVREDALTLFGFASSEEKELFLLFTDVDGIGPKLAMTAVSSAPIPDILSAIMTGNAKFFSNISGIGKKTAEKIIIDLRDKIQQFGEITITPQEIASSSLRQVKEAEQGLVALGFHPHMVKTALARIEKKEDKKAEDIVREALQLIRK